MPPGKRYTEKDGSESLKFKDEWQRLLGSIKVDGIVYGYRTTKDVP